MLTIIDNFLSDDEVERFRNSLGSADWRDGRATAGSLGVTVKHNQQVDDLCQIGKVLGDEMLSKLGNHPRFVTAALPDKIHQPRFNRYQTGESYGVHVDAAIMPLPNTQQVLRTDLSVTLFLASVDDYDGGELVIDTGFGAQEVKLDAGSVVVYPSSSLHHVAPVTRGERLAAICWVQSMVRSEQARSLLFDLDESIQTLTRDRNASREQLLRLAAVYQNLLRLVAEI